MKNRQEHHEDVELGKLLPNEDGTFQKTKTLTVTPDEWKNQYSCLVEWSGLIPIPKVMVNRPKNGNSDPVGIIVGVVVVILLVVISVIGYFVYQKKRRTETTVGEHGFLVIGINYSTFFECDRSE
ncbi:patr class I histocompatibility antigen, alpha chain E-like [Myxocyprinus asiaticus]|uniref:patr class I histocompatibility antigen, alpha chain E-like n=1 Tax=Myxocyprinus asiaticus TaxID=70543 RepID=UPI00222214CC|nr:patr class I histocompatibility antigen, alpha chain E-like [Myxocyprinus asiaticus]